MSEVCKCCAKLFNDEPKGLCCSNGKIKLNLIERLPKPLNAKTIKKYKEFGVGESISLPEFIPVFNIQGQIYHRISLLYNTDENIPKCAHVYYIDGLNDQINIRNSKFPVTKLHITRDIQEMFLVNNDFIRQIKIMASSVDKLDLKWSIHADRVPAGEHAQRYNDRIANGVRLVMVGTKFPQHNIIFIYKNNTVKKMNEFHRSYDLLHHALIHWRGNNGYLFDLLLCDPNINQTVPNKEVTCRQYYAYHLQKRNNWDQILSRKRLFQMYLVDMHIRIELECLLYIEEHQTKLGVKEYSLLINALDKEGWLNPQELSRAVVLPFTFFGRKELNMQYVMRENIIGLIYS